MTADCSGHLADTRNRAQRRARQGRNPNDGRDAAIRRGRRTYRQPGTGKRSLSPGREAAPKR